MPTATRWVPEQRGSPTSSAPKSSQVRRTLPSIRVMAVQSAPLTLKLLELGQGVDVEKRACLLEHHLRAALSAAPKSGPVFAAVDECAEALAQRGSHQAEHRLSAQRAIFPRGCDRDLAVDVLEASCQPRDQIEWKIRRVARNGRKKSGL